LFEDMPESRAREILLGLVDEYWQRFHAHAPKDGRIDYAGRVYDSAEMRLLADSALDFWLTSGKYTQLFESGLAKFLGARYCSFVNSGSSANLLAFMSLTSPLLKERRIMPGDEVITVAACFPTTVAPIVQYGAVPVFIDITLPQYNMNVDALEGALSKKTKAVMAAHTLGNPFDLAAVLRFCRKNNLWLIEDNCDALGTEVSIDGKWVKSGSVGDIGTSSFYPPHHITTGEGGAVYTSNPLLHKIIRSLRDWGRDCTCLPGQDNRCGRRFDGQFGTLPRGYDHKYVYSHFGYNLKATDMQAAIGVAQLEKLPGFILRRRENFDKLTELLSPYSDRLILPQPCPDSRPSWFGFLITCAPGVDRNAVTAQLEADGVQTRTLFAGNILRHPCAEGVRCRVFGGLDNTDTVLRQSFWVGVYPGLTGLQLEKIAASIVRALEKSKT